MHATSFVYSNGENDKIFCGQHGIGVLLKREYDLLISITYSSAWSV
jgi:hypothetical protein